MPITPHNPSLAPARRQWTWTDSPWLPAAVALLSIAIVGWYYAYWLVSGTSGFFAETRLGMTFNSMLEHLLRGEFDVDPAAIGPEGFARNSRVYAYFGIFPALLRLLVLPAVDLRTTDVTKLSCLVAACVFVFFQLLSVLTIWHAARPGRQARWLLAVLLIAILIGGPQIPLLRGQIYHEPVLWAAALAAGFVFCAARGLLLPGGFTIGMLAVMASIAGLCLLTRVSTALGLYAALGLLLAHLFLAEAADRRAVLAARHPGARRAGVLLAACGRALAVHRLLLPLTVLAVFAAVCGTINYQRWDNPLTFANFHLYLMNTHYPDRLPRLEAYGEFNPGRCWFGILYYFFPVWILTDSSGRFIFQDAMTRLIDSVEAPPTSFLICDPLLLGLAVYGLVQLTRGRDRPALDRRAATLLLTGLVVPGGLMLMAISMTMRYRFEFIPFFTLAALIGWQALCWRLPAMAPSSLRWLNRIAVTACLVGVVAVHLVLYMYIWTVPGPADPATVLGKLPMFLPGLSLLP